MLVVEPRLLTNSGARRRRAAAPSLTSTRTSTSTSTDPEHREEGGTPAIVESIRAGLVFALKDAVGVEVIRAHEDDFLRRAIAAWDAHPDIQVLGNPERRAALDRVVRRSAGRAARYLHHNLVVAILNDLFGIQCRGGCSCAGPYGHRLLGIDLERSHEFEREITGGCEGIKPGWVRVNFNYFISDTVFEYVVEAVAMVADHGWKLLPHYRFDPATGLWRHHDGPVEPPLRLHSSRYDDDGVLRYPHHDDRAPESMLAEHLAEAHAIFAALPDEPGRRRRRRRSAPTSTTCGGSTCPPSAWSAPDRHHPPRTVTRARLSGSGP